jgi:hypothetical protein
MVTPNCPHPGRSRLPGKFRSRRLELIATISRQQRAALGIGSPPTHAHSIKGGASVTQKEAVASFPMAPVSLPGGTVPLATAPVERLKSISASGPEIGRLPCSRGGCLGNQVDELVQPERISKVWSFIVSVCSGFRESIVKIGQVEHAGIELGRAQSGENRMNAKNGKIRAGISRFSCLRIGKAEFRNDAFPPTAFSFREVV